MFVTPVVRHSAHVIALCLALATDLQASEGGEELPSPLSLAHVVAGARMGRAEVWAQRARVVAVEQRAHAVSALEDPVISTSVEHLPFSLMGVDGTFAVEQRFPLSSLLRHRWLAAAAAAQRARSDITRSVLDVELEAANAFFMLNERRQMRMIVGGQLELAQQLIAAANARYAAGTGAQAELIRAETEVARLEGESFALDADVRSSEAMLNASLNRSVEGAVPPLQVVLSTEAPPTWAELRGLAVSRPELTAAQAEIARLDSEMGVTRSTYAPMAMVRTGPAYTMSAGPGWMLMVGVSIPIWLGRNRAGIREAEAMAEMARFDLQAMRRIVEGEIQATREGVIAAQARYLASRDSVVPRAHQAIFPALSAYGAGSLPLVSVLDAARALWDAQGALADAELRLGLAWARFTRALGQSAEGSP